MLFSNQCYFLWKIYMFQKPILIFNHLMLFLLFVFFFTRVIFLHVMLFFVYLETDGVMSFVFNGTFMFALFAWSYIMV